MTPKPNFPAKVRAARCATCVFGPNSPIGDERMAELVASWGDLRGGHQICHSHGTSAGGVDVWCAGFYETLPRSLREAFERAGWIRFIGRRSKTP